MMNSLFIRARTLTVTGESVTLIFNTVLPTVHTVRTRYTLHVDSSHSRGVLEQGIVHITEAATRMNTRLWLPANSNSRKTAWEPEAAQAAAPAVLRASTCLARNKCET